MNDTLKTIKRSEIDIIDALQDNCDHIKNLRPMWDNQYSTYDAYNDEYIVEFKTRYKVYQDTQIEWQKVDSNIREAIRQGKKFLYIINDAEGLYVWSITKLMKDGYDFKWHIKRCPKTTSFKNREYINKRVANLPKKLSQWNMKWKEDVRDIDPASLFTAVEK